MAVRTLLSTGRQRLTPFAKFLVVIFAIILALVVYFTAAGEDEDSKILPANNPISFIADNSDIYSVIAILKGKENQSNVNLFIEVCGGFGIDTVFFMTTEYMEENPKLIEKIYAEGHTVGLLCNNTAKLSRSAFMKYLANCNDSFYSLTGKYPKYCHVLGSPSPYAAEVINAYGQYYVSYGVEINAERNQSIKNGFVVAVDLSESDGVYAFARAVSAALENKLKAVSMKEFMIAYESVHES